MNLIPENSLEQILNGDDVTPDDRLEYFVKKAIDNAGSGGGGGADLPEPGTAGNVLTSTGDGWESAAPSGGEFVVTANIIPAQGSMSFSDVSEDYDDILAAVLAGKNVRFHSKYESEEMNIAVDASLTFAADVINNIYGIGAINNDGHVEQVIVNIYKDGSSTYASATLNPFLPQVAAGNNGQILSVSSGSPAWVNPSALSNAPLTVTISQTGNTLSTDKTATEITGALDAGKAVVLRYKVVLGEGTAEETTAWSEKTLVGAYHISAEDYSLIYVEYNGDTDTWDKFTLTAATGADVFSYTST